MRGCTPTRSSAIASNLELLSAIQSTHPSRSRPSGPRLTVPDVTHLLLVEDDEDNAALIRTLLDEPGPRSYAVHWAPDYAHALSALQTRRYDIALVDVYLGAANGIDLIAEAAKAGIDVPFLIMSGTGRPQDLDRAATRAGASDFLPKTHMNAMWLSHNIRHVIERHRLMLALRAEQVATRSSESLLRTVVENTLDSLVVVNDADEVQFANAAARQEWMGRIDRLLVGLAGQISTAPYLAEVTLQEPGMNAQIAEIRSTGVEWQGHTARLLTIRDITLRRALELQLRQAQKMEVIGQMTGGIAHDLNNLLTVILANADILDQGIAAEEREDLTGIMVAARRGAELIRKLMAFGRKQPTSLQLVRPEETMAEFISMVRRLLPASIELTIVQEPDLPVILADPTALDQVLLNLATNARDAMPEGGTLTLTTCRAAVSGPSNAVAPGAPPGEYLSVSLRDSGTGMDSQTQERLFEPFFTTKPEGQGTGLGMAMVADIVDQHHGYIGIDSAPATGTLVTLLFPAVDADAAGTASDVPRRLKGGTETILFVEDESELRRAACRILCRFGYTVLEAANGTEALEQWRRNGQHIALVISDIVMPQLGGTELQMALRAIGERVPFLFSSGYHAGAPAGPHGDGIPLQKPWSIPELATAVRCTLDQSRCDPWPPSVEAAPAP